MPETVKCNMRAYKPIRANYCQARQLYLGLNIIYAMDLFLRHIITD